MQFRVDTDGMTFIVGGIRGVMDFETKVPVLDKSSGVPLFDVDVMAVVAGERPEQLTVRVIGSAVGDRDRHAGCSSGICRPGPGRWVTGTGWRSRRAGWNRSRRPRPVVG